MKRKKWSILILMFFFSMMILSAQPKLTFDHYHSLPEISQYLRSLAQSHPQIAAFYRLAESPSGKDVLLIELGPEIGKKSKSLPAIMVVANLEGTIPLSSEAALYLCQSIINKPEVRKDKTWYILPVGNPDAAEKYFSKPLIEDGRNSKPFNDDKDDKVDEDGPEDLNGDGLITKMRVKAPEGQWLPVPGEPRLMKKVDWTKGERGIYKLYTEGIDNDGDGQYNEDGPGGVDIGLNFPHLFKYFTKTAGLWSGSEEESYNLIKFICSHREIAMTIVFGETNFCLIPPRGGRKGAVDLTKIKIPERIGKMLNIDTERTYTMKEIMDLVKQFVPQGMEVTESMIASFLGLGAVVNPLPEDLKFYQELSQQYKDFLKKNKISTKRLEPPRAKDGAFELWAYYHLGLPSFSLDFWSLPQVEKKSTEKTELTPEKLESMTNEEFLALGEEKIQEFLKSAGALANFKAKMVMDAVKKGMMTTKKMAAMLKQRAQPKKVEGGSAQEKALLSFSDKELEGKGFVNWQPYKHPTLGQVEIGGPVPFASNTPPAKMIANLLQGQVPWVFNLAQKLAHIKIQKTEVKPMGSGIYELKVWVENAGYLPYPTAMGQRNNRLLPIIVTVESKNIKILEGKKRSLIKSLAGHKSLPVRWLIYAAKPTAVRVKTSTRVAWIDSQQVSLGESK